MAATRTSRNILAGVANSVWTALLGLAVVPLYLKYLGIEAYGLIGFFVTMQALFQILDLGLGPTINREVARCSAAGNISTAGRLLHTLSAVYWGMAIIIALLVWMMAPAIAGYWLQSKNLSQETITHAVMLLGLVIACRWPIGLYQGALMGAQRIALSSSINMAMIGIGSLGAVGILAFVSPTIQAFFIWQASVGVVHVVVVRWAAWRAIRGKDSARFDFDELKRIWRFSAGLAGVTLTRLVFTQLDKVLLSKMLGLAEFGGYMLATLAVSGLFVLITPMHNSMYPRFSFLVAAGETEKLVDVYRLATRLLGSILFPLAMLLAVFAQDLVQLWTGDAALAHSVAPLVALLAIGTALHGLMFIPHALQLACGMTRLPLMVNATLMVLMLPLILCLAARYGALGGALAWLILHVLYVLLGTWLMHRKLLIGLGMKWLVQDVGIPLLISVFVGVLGYHVLRVNGSSYGQTEAYLNLLIGICLMLTTCLLSCMTSRQLRAMAFARFNVFFTVRR